MEEAGMPSESGEPAGAPASETTAQAPQLRRQSVGIRFAATVIDVGVLSIISWFFVAIAIGAAFSTAAPIAPASQGNINATIAQVNSTVQQVSGALSAGLATAAVITLIIWFLYYTILEGRYGQTLGKYFCKIKVVKEDSGAPISYGEAAIRTILRIIDGIIDYLIGALLIWTSEKKQRLGDRLAHTVVVQLCDVE
ncbi:MAG: RDD family protein [Halobacteriota archaeon]